MTDFLDNIKYGKFNSHDIKNLIGSEVKITGYKRIHTVSYVVIEVHGKDLEISAGFEEMDYYDYCDCSVSINDVELV